MKVYIGKPPSRVITKLYDWHMERKYGSAYTTPTTFKDPPIENDVVDSFVEMVDDFLQSVANWSINLYLDRKKTTVKIRVDRWDTWNMEYTLSPIIHPMLVQLQKTKHGAPWVDLDDVPEELRSSEKDEHGLDVQHFERWDWVINEMIWAFEQKRHDEDLFDKFWNDENNTLDRKAYDKAHTRMVNGFRLFGKYYENLWD
jgi:hypothetical protein